MEGKSEAERIKKAYERRDERIPLQLYSFFNPAHSFTVQRRDWEIIKAFKMCGITTLADKRILDIGCGTGRELLNLIRYGAKPENLYGLDLLQGRIDIAKQLNPNVDFRCGDAADLPYEDSSFDIVTQFTVFTSIIDTGMKSSIAKEMLRILTPDGIVIWYDYHMNNPKNPDVRGIKKREIYELFPDCEIYLKRVTLAPPVSRVIASFSIILCQVLEKIPLMCTHYLGVIKKVGL
jgi:ubiquinone/menaquinone biosynthesis C-methylase UbiE